MWLPNWLRSCKRDAAPSPRPARRSKAPTARLFLEPLEDRTVPSAGWAIATGGSGGVVGVPALSQPDAAGDLYVTGYFQGTVTFGSTTLTASSNNTSFVSKVDANGNVLWAEQFGGLSDGRFTGISLDGSGNVYLSGNFDGTQSFGGTTLSSPNGSATGYICKVDPSGNFLWAQRFAIQTGGSYGEKMAVDGNGNVYLGWTDSSSTGSAAFLSKVDSASGNFLWTQQVVTDPNTNYLPPSGVALDSSGNAYVSVNGGPGGGYSGFLAKYDPNGNVIWSEATARPILGEAINQDPTTGATWLYTAIWPTTSAPTNVEKLDAATGTVIWSQQVGSPGPIRPQAVAVDTSGNVYLIDGNTGGTDFDPGPGVAFVDNSTVSVVKLDPSGNFLSVWSFGGNSYSIAGGLAVDSSGNFETVGTFNGPMNFDTGSQIVSLTPPTGSTSLFITKTTQDTGMIFGQVFNDLNNNGVFDAGSLESGIPNVTLYLDLNNSGSYVAGDPTAVTDSQGYYHFSDVVPGSYTVRQIVPSGYTATPASFPVAVSAGLASETAAIADYAPNKTRTYSDTTAVSTSKGKPNAVSSLTVSDSYTVLGTTLTLNVSNTKNSNLSIFLTGPNGTKISLGSTNQNGTLTYQVPDFDYTSVKGTWKLEVDGLAGGTLKSWSLNIDGTLS
jgi:hypothetical protein